MASWKACGPSWSALKRQVTTASKRIRLRHVQTKEPSRWWYEELRMPRSRRKLESSGGAGRSATGQEIAVEPTPTVVKLSTCGNDLVVNLEQRVDIDGKRILFKSRVVLKGAAGYVPAGAVPAVIEALPERLSDEVSKWVPPSRMVPLVLLEEIRGFDRSKLLPVHTSMSPKMAGEIAEFPRTKLRHVVPRVRSRLPSPSHGVSLWGSLRIDRLRYALLPEIRAFDKRRLRPVMPGRSSLSPMVLADIKNFDRRRLRPTTLRPLPQLLAEILLFDRSRLRHVTPPEKAPAWRQSTAGEKKEKEKAKTKTKDNQRTQQSSEQQSSSAPGMEVLREHLNDPRTDAWLTVEGAQVENAMDKSKRRPRTDKFTASPNVSPRTERVGTR